MGKVIEISYQNKLFDSQISLYKDWDNERNKDITQQKSSLHHTPEIDQIKLLACRESEM